MKGEETVVETASRLEVHPTQIRVGKRALLEEAATVLDENHGTRQKADEALIAHLYQQIGQLKVERDFLQGKFGR